MATVPVEISEPMPVEVTAGPRPFRGQDPILPYADQYAYSVSKGDRGMDGVPVPVAVPGGAPFRLNSGTRK